MKFVLCSSMAPEGVGVTLSPVGVGKLWDMEPGLGGKSKDRWRQSQEALDGLNSRFER